VRRQPFGGCKASSFGPGAKAGGPNYVAQFCHPAQVGIPHEKDIVPPKMQPLVHIADKLNLSAEQVGLWHASLESYAYWTKHFAQDHDPSKIIGQDNLFRYRPSCDVSFRITKNDSPIDVLRTIAAAISVGCHLDISYSKDASPIPNIEFWHKTITGPKWIEESEQSYLQRVSQGHYKKIRSLSKPPESLIQAAAENATTILSNPVLANGRFELLYFLREISFSIDYHRYGSLGLREGEKRTPIL